jgi:hypothetical protein
MPNIVAVKKLKNGINANTSTNNVSTNDTSADNKVTIAIFSPLLLIPPALLTLLMLPRVRHAEAPRKVGLRELVEHEAGVKTARALIGMTAEDEAWVKLRLVRWRSDRRMILWPALYPVLRLRVAEYKVKVEGRSGLLRLSPVLWP